MLNKVKVGLALGCFAAFMHIVWSVLHAANYAKPVMDLAFKMHMVQNPVTLDPFSWQTALGLVILTGIMGFVVGFIFSFFYNWVHMGAKKKK